MQIWFDRTGTSGWNATPTPAERRNGQEASQPAWLPGDTAGFVPLALRLKQIDGFLEIVVNPKHGTEPSNLNRFVDSLRQVDEFYLPTLPRGHIEGINQCSNPRAISVSDLCEIQGEIRSPRVDIFPGSVVKHSAIISGDDRSAKVQDPDRSIVRA